MNLMDYENAILSSDLKDWTILTCWGYGSGPSFLQESSVWTSSGNDFSNIEVESHSMRASLKSDLSIWIAWGYPSLSDFKEPWANKFADPHASSGYVDFFYNNALVFRDLYVNVDGARCRLPLPHRTPDSDEADGFRLTVSKKQIGFFRLLNEFESTVDFDQYSDRASFKMVDAPWMV